MPSRENDVQRILRELQGLADGISQAQLDAAGSLLLAQNKTIFVTGAGRSGFVARGFANRLMHVGKNRCSSSGIPPARRCSPVTVWWW